MVTHATSDAEPLRVAVNAAVDYVRCFAAHPEPRKSRSASSRRRSGS
jgi:hypothetical protein